MRDGALQEITVVDSVCPDKKRLFENISQDRNFVLKN